MADRYMTSQGYEKINGPISEVTDVGHNGIDGVYRKDGNPPSYVVADAKYGSAGLGTLSDGTKQMSPAWGRGRLEDAVGEEEAFLINMQGFDPQILQVDKYGNVIKKSLKNRK
ncbi:hypothetical protein [Rhizobium halophytocola]|uniref:Cytosolic protein n=1 Tax=Rhizobium halophytocola TaxID=735519 RepID=A0ABS4E3K4_9HYPH|nr:hypothetical protein [Rhizobium halophytocola]MBP1852520.1 hypothetical protein [Rhizobium halophytocola]